MHMMIMITLMMKVNVAVAPVAPKVIQYDLYRITKQNNIILDSLINDRVVVSFHEMYIECAMCSAL